MKKKTLKHEQYKYLNAENGKKQKISKCRKLKGVNNCGNQTK